MRNRLFLAAALAMCFSSTSCLGPNKTFSDLNDWNAAVTENELTNEAIFLGLNIVPVYGVAYLADIIVFNSIEFWAAE
ncbi:MAG: DUF3332 family protein [Planctomycetota bacterium]|nr:DUF3332 family protein [Planctomycetota bacterium]